MSALVPESEVKEIQSQTDKIVAAAQALAVVDDVGMREATDLLGWIARAKKQVEEKRKFFVDPLNKQVKAINAMFKKYSKPLESADTLLRGKVLSYRREQDRIRREEEERLRKLQEREQKRLEKQAAKKDLPPPPPMPTPQVQEQAKTVHSDFGSVSAKKVWDFKIIDPAQIPAEFMMVNEKAIRAAVKAGVRNIPGVKIYQREELAVKSF